MFVVKIFDSVPLLKKKKIIKILRKKFKVDNKSD